MLQHQGESHLLKKIYRLSRVGNRDLCSISSAPTETRRAAYNIEKYAALFRKKHFLTLNQANYDVVVLDSLNYRGSISMALCYYNGEPDIYVITSLEKSLNSCIIESLASVRSETILFRSRVFQRSYASRIRKYVRGKSAPFIGSGLFLY